MYRLLLIVLLLSSFALAQQEAAPVYDPDFEAELTLFNRFFMQGDAQGAYVHAQKLLDIATRKHMPPRELGAAESTVGESLRKMQRYSEAEPHLRRALGLRESVLPKNHYRVLQSVNDLGNVLYLEGKYDDATPLTERAIALYSEMADRDGPDECHYGMALQRLGAMETTKNNLDKAEGLLIRATKSFANTGIGCGQMHSVYSSLATVYWVQNRKDKVEEVYRAALKVFTPDAEEDPDYHYGFYLMSLADVYASEKRYDEAERLYKQAIQASTHIASTEGVGASAPLQMTVLEKYKAMVQASGRKAELGAVDQQLKAAADITGADQRHPEMQLVALKDEAQRAERENRFEDAEKALRREVEVARNLGPADRRVISSETDLASFLDRRKRSDEALATAQKALADAQESFADDPITVGTAYNTLAALYTNRHDDSALESILKQSVQMWQRSPNKANMGYSGALGQLAQFYAMRKQYGKAEPLYLDSLKEVERTQGAETPYLLSPVESLAFLYKNMGQYEKAETFWRRTLALYEKQYGADSPALNQPLYQLSEVMRNLGKPKEADDFAARADRLHHAYRSRGNERPTK